MRNPQRRIQFATRMLFLLVALGAALSLAARWLLSLPPPTASGIVLCTLAGFVVASLVCFVTRHITDGKVVVYAVLLAVVIVSTVWSGDFLPAYFFGMFLGLALSFQGGQLLAAFAQWGGITHRSEENDN